MVGADVADGTVPGRVACGATVLPGALGALLGAAAVPRGGGAALRGVTAVPDGEPVELRGGGVARCGVTAVLRGAAAIGAPGLAVEAGGETDEVARRETVPLPGVPVGEGAAPATGGGVSASPGFRAATDCVRPKVALAGELAPRETMPARTGSVLAWPRPSSVRKLTSSPSCLGDVVGVVLRAAT